jgi:hypothetical protein
MAMPCDALRQHCCMEYARTQMAQLTLALLLVLALLQGLEPRSAAVAHDDPTHIFRRASLASDGPHAATNLRAVGECSMTTPRQDIVRFTWVPAASTGRAQRIELTEYKGGFASGQLLLTKGLSKEQSSHAWKQSEPGILYYWRVLTLQPGGWISSEIADFYGPTCVANHGTRP